jgi:hypothetical protein
MHTNLKQPRHTYCKESCSNCEQQLAASSYLPSRPVNSQQLYPHSTKFPAVHTGVFYCRVQTVAQRIRKRFVSNKFQSKSWCLREDNNKHGAQRAERAGTEGSNMAERVTGMPANYGKVKILSQNVGISRYEVSRPEVTSLCCWSALCVAVTSWEGGPPVAIFGSLWRERTEYLGLTQHNTCEQQATFILWRTERKQTIKSDNREELPETSVGNGKIFLNGRKKSVSFFCVSETVRYTSEMDTTVRFCMCARESVNQTVCAGRATLWDDTNF